MLTLDDKRESIIDFYNKVFSQSMKPYLMQFSPTRQQMPPLSPIPLPPSSSSVMASPLRQQHPQRCNVSLLNESSFRHHLAAASASTNQAPLPPLSTASTNHVGSAAPTPPMTPQTTRLYCFGESPGPSRSTIHSINAAVRSGVRSGVSRNLSFSALSNNNLGGGGVGGEIVASASSSSASSSRDHSRHTSPVTTKPTAEPTSTNGASSSTTPGSRGVTRRRRLGFDNSNESSEDDAEAQEPRVKRGRATAQSSEDAEAKNGVGERMPANQTRGGRIVTRACRGAARSNGKNGY